MDEDRAPQCRWSARSGRIAINYSLQYPTFAAIHPNSFSANRSIATTGRESQHQPLGYTVTPSSCPNRSKTEQGTSSIDPVWTLIYIIDAKLVVDPTW